MFDMMAMISATLVISRRVATKASECEDNTDKYLQAMCSDLRSAMWQKEMWPVAQHKEIPSDFTKGLTTQTRKARKQHKYAQEDKFTITSNKPTREEMKNFHRGCGLRIRQGNPCGASASVRQCKTLEQHVCLISHMPSPKWTDG